LGNIFEKIIQILLIYDAIIDAFMDTAEKSLRTDAALRSFSVHQ
jgi:hypothetical protein